MQIKISPRAVLPSIGKVSCPSNPLAGGLQTRTDAWPWNSRKHGSSEAHCHRPVRTIHPAMQPMWSTWSHPIRMIGRSGERSHFLKCLINHQTGLRVSTKMWRRAKVTPPAHPRTKPNSRPWTLPCTQAAGCDSRSFLTAIHSFCSSQSAVK